MKNYLFFKKKLIHAEKQIAQLKGKKEYQYASVFVFFFGNQDLVSIGFHSTAIEYIFWRSFDLLKVIAGKMCGSTYSIEINEVIYCIWHVNDVNKSSHNLNLINYICSSNH